MRLFFLYFKQYLPICFLLILTTACSSVNKIPDSYSNTRSNNIAEVLNDLYNSTTVTCDTIADPSFLCSGIILRATETNINFFPWNPSPNSQQRGGVSFSWLRQDSNFSRAAFSYQNGFIFYPERIRPSNKLKISALCYFPVDGDTVNRPSQSGCGANIHYLSNSRMCHELTPPVSSAYSWYTHYTSVPTSSGNFKQHQHQCAFDVKSLSNSVAGLNFHYGVESRRLLTTSDKAIQNELMLDTWPQNIPSILPIMAFYYLGGTNESNALKNAQSDQSRFYIETKGQVIPIVKITLPAEFTGKALFNYYETDQVVGNSASYYLYNAYVSENNSPADGASQNNMVMLIKDKNGNNASGLTMKYVPSSANIKLFTETDVNVTNGISQVQAVTTVPGTYTITATLQEDPTVTYKFTITFK